MKTDQKCVKITLILLNSVKNEKIDIFIESIILPPKKNLKSDIFNFTIENRDLFNIQNLHG